MPHATLRRRKAEAERDALRAAQAWQPIETAPKDGTAFLGVVNGRVRVVQWGKTSHVPIWGFCLADQGVEEFDLCNPSQGMPLPPAPGAT